MAGLAASATTVPVPSSAKRYTITRSKPVRACTSRAATSQHSCTLPVALRRVRLRFTAGYTSALTARAVPSNSSTVCSPRRCAITS